MEFGPIFSSLRRSPTGAILVALQIALALAITANSLYIITQRLEAIGRDSGMDVPNLFVVVFAPVGKAFNGEAAMREDVQVLRSLPGVVDAVAINCRAAFGRRLRERLLHGAGREGRPVARELLRGGRARRRHARHQAGRRPQLRRQRGPQVPAQHFRDAARNDHDEGGSRGPFPGQSAVGKTVYDGLGQPSRVVGVVELMHGAWPSWSKFERVILQPVIPDEQQAVYMVRAKPGQRDAMMALAEQKLGAIDNGRIITKVRSLEYIAANTYADDRAMAVYMTVVIALLLGIAALGVFGLAAFNVSTRTKQIGTRRAVGARRFDIVRYFLVENWMVTTVGVFAGCVLALLLGYWLSTAFELPRLKLYYLLAGVVGLWAVGLAAALLPARRASLVSPAVATRTV